MTNRQLHIFAAAAFALASSCSGCFGCTPPGMGDGGNLPGKCESEQPLIGAQKLEVLFVIDNSISMKEEQEGVARELTAFVDELKKGGGVAQDFHIGVITTSVYQHTLTGSVPPLYDYNKLYLAQSGKLQPVPDLNPDGGGVLLGTGTERVLMGDDPRLVEKFSRLVQQGITGSGQETPFEAVRLAVTELDKIPLDGGGNGGFLRAGARLLVVVLTDEDDCSEIARPSRVTVGENSLIDYCTEQGNSLTPVAEYHRIFTEELKDSAGRKRDLIWTAIAPVGLTSKAAMAVIDVPASQVRNIDCPTSNEPGLRHRKLAEMFDPKLENLDSICRTSYRETLLAIAALANVTQSIEVSNVPDPRMMTIELTRKDLSAQKCTIANGGLASFDAGVVFFDPSCKRRSDDVKLELKLLCVN